MVSDQPVIDAGVDHYHCFACGRDWIDPPQEHGVPAGGRCPGTPVYIAAVGSPDELALVLRVARQQWGCEDAEHEYPDCDATIFPREHYVEYLGESSAYESGHRYCLACARRVWNVRVQEGEGLVFLSWSPTEGTSHD